MFTFLSLFLRSALLYVLYFGGIITMIATISKKAEWGLYLLVAIIPQPNIIVKLYDFPMGKDFINFLFLSILIGIFINKNGFIKNFNSIIIILFSVVSYFALLNSSMQFSLPLPITFDNPLFKPWKNYVMMIFLYLLVINAIKNERQQKILVVIMCIVILFIAIRSYRAYSLGEFFTGSRYEGPFWVFGLGANHFGAFIVHYWSVFLALFLFDNDRKRKLLYLATILLSIHPLFASYSRGAYLGALGVMVFLGIIKKRILLVIALVILIFWQSVLPQSVVDRVLMTQTDFGELEHSAAVRLDLWDHAMKLFTQNPVFGIGFGGFQFSVPEGFYYTDTHNFFMKTLSEQGVIGFTLLLFILFLAFRSGWRLFKIGGTPFHKGLGFGFLGCIIACIITNMFGDRWSYFVLGGYFWVFWGLVDRGILISQEADISKDKFEE